MPHFSRMYEAEPQEEPAEGVLLALHVLLRCGDALGVFRHFVKGGEEGGVSSFPGTLNNPLKIAFCLREGGRRSSSGPLVEIDTRPRGRNEQSALVFS